MLCTLNSHGVMCQLYLNKAGREKEHAADLKKATAGDSLLTTLLPLHSKFFLEGGSEQGEQLHGFYK